MAKTQDRPQRAVVDPGRQSTMDPKPIEIRDDYKGSDKLSGKVAIITGGDSGIGRSVAIHFATEGADVVIVFLAENDDAAETQKKVEGLGRQCLAIKGDVGDPSFCKKVADKTIDRFKRIDILVNNAAEQHPQESIEKITPDQLEKTFRTNIFGMFYMVQACIPHLKEDACIINTTSVTNYKGSGDLLDYSATKGAVTAFTRSLSESLVERKIRVNGVAPGPIWTPLIPSTFKPEEVADFGKNTPMKRPGQPSEVAPCYVFLASEDASYMTGQVLHPNGGTIVNT
jgi:NAD(P)-dependent dehydrogenase (short-subunit alcohol dehydrogenase family)